MKNYRYFNKILLGLLLVICLLSFAFNIFIDPFGVMNSPEIKGLNKTKPETYRKSRLYKAITVSNQNAKTIFLGASRVETGLNPDNPALQNYQPVYNLGLPGGTLYEERRYLEYAILTQKNLELVILGIDLWQFLDPTYVRAGFEEERLKYKGLRLEEKLKINLSLDTINSSILTIEESKKNPDYVYYYANGLKQVSKDEFPFDFFLKIELNRSEKNLYSNAIENLKIIKNICEENKLKLITFITPPHASYMEARHIAGYDNLIEEAKKTIINIIPVWDFYGYSSINTEPFNKVTFYRDASHFLLPVGDLILNRIIDYNTQKIPEDFGFWVTLDNLNEHLDKIKQQRQIWLKNNQDTVELLETLKERT